MSEPTQACDCRDWSCGLPACEECAEDHGGLEHKGRRLCRDCWQESMMDAINEHEKTHPGALKKRIAKLGELLRTKNTPPR